MILLKNRDRNPSFKKGEYVEINDAGNYPMELSVDGVCEQETTSGKNLIDSKWKTKTLNGITVTNNEDGTYTLNGTSTSSTAFALIGFTGGALAHPIINNIRNNVGKYITLSTGYSSSQGFYIQLNLSKQAGGGEQYGFVAGVSTYANKLISSNEGEAAYINFFLGIHPNASFNNLKIYPMVTIQDNQISTAPIPTDFEPYTGGQPSPSPDYPQEIKTITGNIKVTSCGKNLFDGEIELGNITPTDGKLVDSNSRTRSKNFTKVKPNTTYSFTRTTGQYRWVIGYTKDKIGITDGNFKEQASALYQVYADKFTFQFTTSPTTEYIKWYDTDSVNLNEKVQIERGSIVTEYEPYQGSSLNITIPENEFVGKLDDTYKDTLNVVYKDDGQYHLVLNKMIGKVVLDGSEEGWLYDSNNKYFRTNTYVFERIPLSLSSENKAMYSQISNSFIINKNWSGTNSFRDNINVQGEFYPVQNKGYKLAFRNLNFDNVDDFKSWLSTHNTEVYYPLATPYEVDLGIVDTLLSYDNITNVFSDSDLYPVINVKYYKDFEFDKILRSGYNIDEQEYEIAKKQMANGKRKRILSSYDDCIIKINLGLLDNKTYQEYKEHLDDGEFHYWSYKYNQYKKANFILTKPSITTEYAYDDDIGIDDMEITLEKSSDVL